MNAATPTEWITAAAIGTSTLPLLALAAHCADRDLPHPSLNTVHETAAAASEWTRMQLAAWLLLIAWHIGPKEAH